MLGVVGLSLKMVKFEPTTANMSQHIARVAKRTQHVACCDRLAAGLNAEPNVKMNFSFVRHRLSAPLYQI